jgi:hypothetical protein
LLLLETFVDPQRFTGTLYRAANWLDVGETRGLRRQRGGDRTTRHPPKRVFLRPLTQTARAVLACAVLEPRYRHRGPRLMSSAEPMRALPASFTDIPDPRRAQGRRHPLPTVLAIAAATLCGMRGYKAIAEWAADLGQAARARRRCRSRHGRSHVPSAPIPPRWTARGNAGTPISVPTTRASRLTARPCATPSTPMANAAMS